MAKAPFRFRIIPITLVACCLFIVLKIDDIAIGQKYLARGKLPPAYAEDAKEDATKEEKAKEDNSEEKKTDADKTDDKSEASEESDGAEEKTEGEGEEGEAKDAEPENKNVSLTPPEDVVNVDGRFNQIELDILQSLSKRREEIEKYAEEVALREKLLEATEMRVDGKIKKMESMNVELQKLLKKNKKQEDSEMRSLVKIYESMKPKDAARIFNELDMDIMLDVIDRMSERKAAPILANMDSSKAKDLTVKMAEMRRLRQQVKNNLSKTNKK